LCFLSHVGLPRLPSFPTRRSSDLGSGQLGWGWGSVGGGAGAAGLWGGASLGALGECAGGGGLLDGGGSRGLIERGRCRGLIDGADRKSTRLNSSHEWISYAVFCLI